MSMQLVRAVEGGSLDPLSMINVPGNSSRLSCAVACYISLMCSSFFYRDDGSCVLTQQVYTPDQLVYTDPFWEYFVWTRDGCPESYSWHRRLQLCYRVYTVGTAWQAAEDQCIQDGGHLITVDNFNVSDWINEQASFHEISLWTGGQYLLNDATWVWVDGNTPADPLWDDSQPNGGTRQQYCICIYSPSTNQFKLHDLHCSETLGYVCQINTSSTTCAQS